MMLDFLKLTVLRCGACHSLTNLLRVITGLQTTQQTIQMQHRPRLQVLDQWRQQVVHLLAAVLQLRRLPYYVYVLVGDFALHRQEAQDYVALFDYLRKYIKYCTTGPSRFFQTFSGSFLPSNTSNTNIFLQIIYQPQICPILLNIHKIIKKL